MKKLMLLLLLAAVTTAFGGTLAYDDFNSYSPGDNLLTKTGWTELFASDDPVVEPNVVYAGMGNSIGAVNEHIPGGTSGYASAKIATSRSIDLTSERTYVTGLMYVEAIGAANDSGLFLGFAIDNSNKFEVRFYKNRNQILLAGTTYQLPAGTFQAGKTYLCVTKTIPEAGGGSYTAYAGVTEFTGYPLGSTEITYQAIKVGVTTLGMTSYTNAIWFPRGLDHYIDMAYVGETWADVQNPAPIPGYVYTPELAAYYPMDDGSGTTAVDKAKGNDATANGTVTWTDGQVAGGCDLGGTREFNNGAIPSLEGSTGLTVSGWFYPTSSGSYRGAFMTRGVTDNEGSGKNYGIAWDTNHWECRTSGRALDSTNTPALNTWYHVVQVWDGAAQTTTLYVNGAVDISQARTETTGISACTTWPIGDDGDRRFPGIVDELAIWNYAFSAQDVNDLYHDGLAGIGADGSMPGFVPVSLNDVSGGTVLLGSDYVAVDVNDVPAGFPAVQHTNGNGSFEDVYPFSKGNPDWDLPFRIGGNANVTGEDMFSIDGWNFFVDATNNGGIQQAFGTADLAYEGDYYVFENIGDIYMTSTYPMDISGMSVGDPVVVEIQMGQKDNDRTRCTNYVGVEIGGTQYVLDTFSYDQSVSGYYKQVVRATLPAAGSVMHFGFVSDMVAEVDQMWYDNFKITTHPSETLWEDGGVSATFDVVLDREPNHPVTIPLVLAVEDAADYPKVTLSPASLSFNSSNWNVAQTVTATPIDNTAIDGDRQYLITFDAAALVDANSVPVPDVMGVTVLDDDLPRVTVDVADGLEVAEQGQTTDTFNITLQGKTSADITVTVTDLNNEMSFVTSPIVFNAAAVSTHTGQTQTVTIQALDDTSNETVVHTATLLISAETNDAGFLAAMPNDFVTANVLENDCGATDFVHDIMDVNGDCIINLVDFAELASRWQACTLPNVAECNL